MYRAGRVRVGQRRPALDLAEAVRRLGRRCRCCSSRAPSGTTRWPPTCWAGVVEVASGQRLDEFFAAQDLRPAGHDRHRRSSCRSPRPRPRLAALYMRGPERHGGAGSTPWASAAPQPAGRCSAGAGGWCPPRPTTTASPRCSWTGRAARRRARRRPAARPAHGGLHGPQPPARRRWTWRPSAGRCSPRRPFRRRRLRPGLRGGHRPGCRARCSPRPGEFSWGGAASTAFWVDPAEDLTVSFFTQLLPSSTYPIRPQLRQLVYQALVR